MADKLETWMTFYSDDGTHYEFTVNGRTRQLYLNGEAVITERRWGSTERRLAYTGLAIAGIGVLATVVQAWAAVAAI